MGPSLNPETVKVSVIKKFKN
ncbi:hypothetical protein DESC_730110 [Desulfosarcina cetonica]|nr:hypothetical protein DESC_730110 [Desulfosarcina cetonica]